MNILNVTEKVVVDNSIQYSEYHTHQPYASTSYNKNDEIRISIPQQDNYPLPCNSYIYIEGKLKGLKKDGTTPSSSFKVINNFLAYLFSEIRFELNGVVVDSVRNVGLTSTIKNYLSYNKNESSKLINAGWNPLESGQTNPILDASGNFNACIPLKVLLGFAEDFKKIILNIKQELVLIRSNTDLDSVINTQADETVNIQIDRISWRVPHISVGIAQQLRLTKYLDKNIEIPIAFRSWELYEYPVLPQTTRHTWAVKTSTQLETPRYIILGFQKDKKNKLLSDMSKFDHSSLTNIKVFLNSERYPYDNLNLDFDNSRFATAYEMFSDFQKSYYGKECEPIFTPTEFKTIAPLFVINCSNQKETLQSSSVEIRIEFETGSNIPPDTSAYCLIIHDRMFTYSPLTKAVRQL